MSSVNIESVITRNEKDFLANPVGQEIVIMDIKSGNYIGLNPVAAHIWKLLEQPGSVARLITELMKVYDIDENTCIEQTLEYLNKMLEQGLVQMSTDKHEQAS